MSEPMVSCAACGRCRSPMLHLKSKPPPKGARAYLKRTCSTPRYCDLQYRAGISPDLAALIRRTEEP